MLMHCTGSIQPHKKWPIHKFSLLIKELHRYNKNYKFLIFGTKNDHSLGEELIKDNEATIYNLALSRHIPVTAFFMKIPLLITNDGGAAHLATQWVQGCFNYFRYGIFKFHRAME